MTWEEKGEVLEELKKRLSNNSNIYVVNGQGMTVDETNRFRKACFDNGLGYKVYKNTLIAKALQEQDGENIEEFNDQVLRGMSGIIFSEENGAEPARLLKEFHKKNNKRLPALKGASIEGAIYIGEDQLDTLTKIKTRAELIGEVVGLIQAPGRRLAGALQSGGGKVAGLVKAIAEKSE